MTRFELLGRIMNHLHQLTDVELQNLLTTLECEITDETMNVIIYGANDTEHLLSSQQNAEDLNRAMQELSLQEPIIPDTSHAA